MCSAMTYTAMIRRMYELAEIMDESDSNSSAQIALKSEYKQLKRSSGTLLSRHKSHRYFLRLLNVIDSYAVVTDIPPEYIKALEDLCTELGMPHTNIVPIVAKPEIRKRTIAAITRLVEKFLNEDLYGCSKPGQDASIEMTAYFLIDRGIERKILAGCPETRTKLESEPPVVIKELYTRCFGPHWPTIKGVEGLFAEIQKPERIAILGARLGDPELVHRGLAEGAKNYGEILASLNQSVNRAPCYLLNMDQRKVLCRSLITLVRGCPEKYRIDRSCIYLNVKSSNESMCLWISIGSFDPTWLEDLVQ